MFKKILQLFNQSLVYGIGTIFERLLGFALVPIFTHVLSKAEFGIYVLWMAYVALFVIFYALGLNSALIRFYTDSDAPRQRKLVFSTIFLSVLAVSLVLTLAIFFNQRYLSNALFGPETDSIVVKIMAAVLLLNALNLIGLNTLKAENRAASFLWISLASGGVMLGLTLYFLIIAKSGTIGALWAIFFSDAFKFLLLTLILTRKRFTFRFSFSLLKTMLQFGLPFIPTVLAVALMGIIDRYLIKKLIGLEMVGIYGTGYRLAMVLALFNKAFQYAWEPFIVATHSQPHARELFAKIFTYFLCIISFIFTSFTLLIDPLVRLKLGSFTLFGPEYYQSTSVVPTLMLSSLIYGCYLNFIIGVYIEKKSYYFIIISGVGVAVAFVANLLLIQICGIQGAAWATVIAYAVMAIWLFFLNQRLYKILYEYARIGKLALVVGATIIFAKLSPFEEWDTVFKLVLIGFFPVALFLIGFFHKHELARLKTILSAISKGIPWQN
ncbi:oligosaccharide flippase family protein [candidate division KSB1 bacterium]|nr:oligosaccharide flippase family protein [candidate division KSB1 bacterium]